MLDRRKFISFIPASVAAFGLFGAVAPRNSFAASSHEPVSAIEILSRGHGLLIRMIIIYELSAARANKGEKIDPAIVLKTTQIIRHYLHDYHEKMEEQHVFAPLERAQVCFNSIQELKVQHGSSYELTGRIEKATTAGKLNSEVTGYMIDYATMYKHHSAWEDTVIFPAFDAHVNKKDIAELASVFASEEHKILGHDGFDSFLNQVADLEKQLGIFELSSSTPKIS